MTYFRINPVLALLLLLTAIAAALPFISYAPNRLVSGEGRHLWQLWPQTIWMLVGVGCAWMTACFIPAKKGSIFALILAQFVFVLLVWGAGKAATQLAQNGSALARTSLGSGFWLAAALALLACSDAIRRISTHPLWRWLLHMQIAIIPLWLLYSGTLNDLSLMKEYANRQDVFDDALAQHLTLLFGAVLPALVIGVPLGVWCYFSTARQGAIFSLLNVIQTVPSVALFGLLIAPLAGLVTGIFHTAMGIPAILAGILTQLGLYSINLRILANSSNQAVSVDKYSLLVSLRYIKGVPFYKNTILICIVILIVLIALLYWFFGTELGCSIRATGSNPNMSRAQGINTDFCKILGLMLSNGIVAFASALYAQYQGFADVNMGRGAIVIGLAAVIIGEVIFSRVRGNFAFKLFSAALGAIIYYIVLQVVLWLGLNSNDLKLFSALVVALFLAIPYLKDRYSKKTVKKGGASRA